MPYKSVQISTTANRVLSTATIALETRRLKAVTIRPVTDGIHPASCYAELGIVTEGTSQANRRIAFGSGYFGSTAPLHVFADHIPDLADTVYANVFTDDAINVRLTIETEGV